MLSLTALSLLAAAPYPAALDRAAIALDRLDDIREHALILGNGDLNGLLHTDGGQIVLRVTKNDVWDARLACEDDPPLPTMDLIRRRAAEGGLGQWMVPDGWEWTGTPNMDSYGAKPYPCPIACAAVRFGDGGASPSWRLIRSAGTETGFVARDGAAVMSLRGAAGASNGYAFGPLASSTDEYNEFSVTVAGSPNARFFVELMDPAGERIRATYWQESPAAPMTRTWRLPPGRPLRELYCYTWTDDGEPAENRFTAITLRGPAGERSIDLTLRRPPTSAGRLDVARAVATIAGGEQTPRATVRCQAQRNAFIVETDAAPTLTPSTAMDLPAAEVGEAGGARWLHQAIPGDADWPGLSYAVAVAGAPGRWAVAVVTSREAADPVGAARGLAAEALADAAGTTEHEAAWRAFWSASGVSLDDAELEAAWYRNLYFLRCVSKPGVVSTGLFAGLVNDTPAWHGDYHTNYNIQQTYWSAYNTNHPELAEPYDRLMIDYLPRAEWLAEQVFGIDGAFYPLIMFAYETDPADSVMTNRRQYVHHWLGLTLGLPAFTAQPLWYHYLYDPSPALLERIYPVLRSTAKFYRAVIDAAEVRDGRLLFGPTVSPEHWGWTPNFERNWNCAFDLALVRYILRAAARAAGTLGRDADDATAWLAAESRLPSYPISDGDPPVVVDVDGAPPVEYNIAIPAVPVFPGDVVDFRSPAAERELFARSVDGCRWNGNNSTFILGVARARLNVGDPVAWLKAELTARLRPNGTFTLNRLGHPFNDYGHYTEQFAASMAVGELLLQSVGDVLRIFPAWPAERDASFRDLRAQGGFLVTARQAGGRVVELTVRSTVGGPLRLKSPWPTLRLVGDGRLQPELPLDADGIAEVATEPGMTLGFSP